LVQTDANRKVMDVDKEYVMVFHVVDENKSWFLDENINTYIYIPQVQ
jgi:hypothetical protein